MDIGHRKADVQLVAWLIGAKLSALEPAPLFIGFEARIATSTADEEKGNLRALLEILDRMPDRLGVMNAAKIA